MVNDQVSVLHHSALYHDEHQCPAPKECNPIYHERWKLLGPCGDKKYSYTPSLIDHAKPTRNN